MNLVFFKGLKNLNRCTKAHTQEAFQRIEQKIFTNCIGKLANSVLRDTTRAEKFFKDLPTAIRWSVGTFARLTGSVFAFLQENPLRDCHLRTPQTSRRHTKNFVRVCCLWLNKISFLAVARTMCHVGAKCARPFIAPSSEPQGGLTLTEPPRPYFLKFDDKKQERWEEAVNSINFSHSNRKAWCTNNKLQKRTSSHIVIFKWGAIVWGVSWPATLFIMLQPQHSRVDEIRVMHIIVPKVCYPRWSIPFVFHETWLTSSWREKH